MLPVPLTITINELLDRCASNYHSLIKEKNSGEINFTAKKIFVNDEYEIVDLKQLVGECFSDFMQITVKAITAPVKSELKSNAVNI